MNSPLISIIVPVYQVEKYLEKCINSIITQTYKNLEIILIDDGSTDKSPSFCDHFQAKDSRIKVLHQENGGLSYARNVGLKIATGDFIGFVDSDDWIEPNMYEVLMSALQETGADIAVCNRQYEFNDSESIPIHMKSAKKKLYSAEEALRRLIIGDKIIHNAVWEKLYRRTIISDIKFPIGKIFEDSLWTTLVIGNAKLIICIDYPLYHYFIRSESLSHNLELTIKRGEDKIEMIERRTEYIRMKYPTLQKLSFLNLLNSCCSEYINISSKNYQFDADGIIRQHLYQRFRQAGFNNILHYDGIKTTCGRILFWFCPNLLVKTYSLYKKLNQ